MTEPLDIRKITQDNMDELAELTGRPKSWIEQEYWNANANGRDAWMLISNVFVTPRRPKPKPTDCDYDAMWSEKVGWIYICRIHNKPSWHDVVEQPGCPCTAIDPKPDDA